LIARFALLALAPALMHAHLLSVSTGDLTVRGKQADYVLRVPFSEVPSAQQQAALLDHIQFRSHQQTGVITQRACFVRGETVICAAQYQFAQPVDAVDVECTLYRVASPTHVHILRANNAGREEEVLLDYALPHSTITFAPVTPFLAAGRQFAAALVRSIASPAQWLLLFCVILAVRTGREALALGAGFLLAYVAGSIVWPNWQLSAQLIEAALALAVSYLAIEILFLPHGRGRWLPIGLLGSINAALNGQTGWQAWSIAGQLATPLLVLAILALWMNRRQHSLLPRGAERVTAALLLALGITGFVIRLNS
jgi:hypothetical protein